MFSSSRLSPFDYMTGLVCGPGVGVAITCQVIAQVQKPISMVGLCTPQRCNWDAFSGQKRGHRSAYRPIL